MTEMHTADAQTEDSRTTWRRRLQQQRCLACGARTLINHQTSYFCAAHIDGWRYCSTCETLRTVGEHGKDSRCKGCARDKALSYYHQYPDATIYRIRLRQIANRQTTRGDQIFAHMRRRIALAELVKRTPDLSWPKRACLFGGCPQQLAYQWRQQQRATLRDVDAADRARDQYWAAATSHPTMPDRAASTTARSGDGGPQ